MSAIFEDLEINRDDMMTDTVAFSTRVHDKADELRAICKSDTSVNALMSKVKDQAKNTKLPVNLQGCFDDAYVDADACSMAEIVVAIDAARKLVHDLETMLKDKAVYESTRDSAVISDKRIAWTQYKLLREAFDKYRAIFPLLFEGQKIPDQISALPGNFGSGLSPLRSYVYVVNGEEYRNPKVIMKHLGLPNEDFFVSDLHKYLEENETDVEVKEVVY